MDYRNQNALRGKKKRERSEDFYSSMHQYLFSKWNDNRETGQENTENTLRQCTCSYRDVQDTYKTGVLYNSKLSHAPIQFEEMKTLLWADWLWNFISSEHICKKQKTVDKSKTSTQQCLRFNRQFRQVGIRTCSRRKDISCHYGSLKENERKFQLTLPHKDSSIFQVQWKEWSLRPF